MEDSSKDSIMEHLSRNSNILYCTILNLFVDESWRMLFDGFGIIVLSRSDNIKIGNSNIYIQ